MTKPIILYHANCLDGTGAKYAAWKKFWDNGATYIPVQYGKPIPESVEYGRNEEVYILDFSYPRDILLRLRSQHRFVKVIDHHKTAEADLTGLDDCIFDMTKSGAVLAWEYFHPGEPLPTILECIQDRDLWQWKIFNTKEITTGLSQLKGDMVAWENSRPHRLFESGKVLCEYIDDKVDSATRPDRVKFIKFKEFKAGILNSTGYGSEICQEIYSKYSDVDIAISYFIEVDGSVILSLRSDNRKPDSCDVSAIAKQFGGGGHKNAAGCKTDLSTLQIIINGEFK